MEKKTFVKLDKKFKTPDCFYPLKIILIILGVIVLTFTTVFNSYRVYLLQVEVNGLKNELNMTLTNLVQSREEFLHATITREIDINKLIKQLENSALDMNEGRSLMQNTLDRLKREDTVESKRFKPDSANPRTTLNSLKTKLKNANSNKATQDSMLGDDPYADISDQEYSDNGYLPRRRYRPRVAEIETLDERPLVPKMGRMKPLPTVHYNGDTSRFVVGVSDNFNGNGHLRHDTNFMDWKPSSWVDSLSMSEFFTLNNHTVRIRQSGIYFIYAQIYYLTLHDTNGFRVYKNDETVLQCTTTAHSNERKYKGNTCFTAGAEYLAEGDEISLGDVEKGRYTLFEQGKSFFGIVKLGDVKIK